MLLMNQAKLLASGIARARGKRKMQLPDFEGLRLLSWGTASKHLPGLHSLATAIAMPFANFALAAAAPGTTFSWFPGGCSPGTPSEASSCPRLSQRRRTSRLCRSQLPPRLRAHPRLDRGDPVLKRTADLLSGLRRDYHELLPVRSREPPPGPEDFTGSPAVWRLSAALPAFTAT